MLWKPSHRADPPAVALADRHYSRKRPGTPQFVSPGRCLVFLTESKDALWVSSWPEYVKHDWPGSWMCSIFRNEGDVLSSRLIREAVAATRWNWPDVPALGMVTFVDRAKTKPKRDPGYCFQCAGFSVVGKTRGGLVVLQLLPEDMPEPEPPLGAQLRLF